MDNPNTRRRAARRRRRCEIANRVPAKIRWYGPPVPDGTPVRVDGKEVGVVARGGDGRSLGGLEIDVLLDQSFADKLSLGAQYGMPQLSLLIDPTPARPRGARHDQR